MAKSRRKKGKFDDTIPLKDCHLAMSWCLKNGIKIYVEPLNWRQVKIIVEDNGKRYESRETYNQTKLRVRDKLIHEEVYKTYIKYYNERSGKTIQLEGRR
jgi:hypothetical protein